MVLHPFRYKPGTNPFQHFSQNLLIPRRLKNRLIQFAKKIEKKQYAGLDLYFSQSHLHGFLRVTGKTRDSQNNYIGSYIAYIISGKTGEIKKISQLKQVYYMRIDTKSSHYEVQVTFMLSKTDILSGTLYIKKGSLVFYNKAVG